MKKEIKEGEMIPKYYGLAYTEVWRHVAVCYPIPLNILVAIVHRIWGWLKKEHRLYSRGYEKGYLKGEELGRYYAFHQYKDQVLSREVEMIVKNTLDEWGVQFKKGLEDEKSIEGWIWDFIDKEKLRIKKQSHNL